MAALVVCLGLAWANRRARATRTKGQPGRLEHRGSLALTGRSAVHLIRVDEHLVALTTDSTGVRQLAVLAEPFEDALARAASATSE
jgi:flagellar biogenesis protein FliO